MPSTALKFSLLEYPPGVPRSLEAVLFTNKRGSCFVGNRESSFRRCKIDRKFASTESANCRRQHERLSQMSKLQASTRPVHRFDLYEPQHRSGRFGESGCSAGLRASGTGRRRASMRGKPLLSDRLEAEPVCLDSGAAERGEVDARKDQLSEQVRREAGSVQFCELSEVQLRQRDGAVGANCAVACRLSCRSGSRLELRGG